MIRINLLPEEFRRQKRSSIGVLLAITGAVAVNGVLGAWYGWLAFGVAAEIESERAVLQIELDGLKPQVDYHKSLDAEQKQFASRETTLAGITKSRVSWTRKLDELVSVANNGGEGQRHFVWFDDLSVQHTLDGRSKTPGSLKASGFSGSENFAQVANFLEDIERSQFVEDFEKPAAPEGSQSKIDKELIPSIVWAFPLQLTLKAPPAPPAKPAATPKPAPEAQQ